jgi:hypothetical protein
MDTVFIIDNLCKAKEHLASISEDTLDLSMFRRDGPACGTLACSAGHLCDNPHFAQFMKLERDQVCGSWRLCVFPLNGFEWRAWRGVGLDDYFGPDAFQRLFAERGRGYLDQKHPAHVDAAPNEYPGNAGIAGSVPDKDLALWRIDQQIIGIKLREN